MVKNKRLIVLVTTLLVFVILSSVSVSAATPKTISVPQGYGYGTLHTYTPWDKINWGSNCLKLKNFANEKNAISNNCGIVTYGSYFCGALTSTYGKVGDMMLVVEEGNIVYPVIMADTKNQSNAGCNKWGHKNGKCIVEFEILSSYEKSLYKGRGVYISDVLAKPIVKVINIGSVWESTAYLWNPKQACLDNGLEGYTLLTSPYSGEIVKDSRSLPKQTTALASNSSDKAPKQGLINIIIQWFNELIA